MPAPIFENVTSPLVTSNDGRLQVITIRDGLPSTPYEVVHLDEPAGDRTLIRTYVRELADAYIAGYDEAQRRLTETPFDS